MEGQEDWVKQSTSQIGSILTDLDKIWSEIGLPTSRLVESRNSALDGSVQHLRNALSTATKEKTDLEKKIKEMMCEIKHIESELRLIHRKFPVFTSLMSNLENVHNYRQELDRKIAELTAEFNILRSQEKELCRYLEVPPLEGFPLIPKPNHTLSVQCHIDELKRLKSERLSSLLSMKKRILSCMAYLKSDSAVEISESLNEVLQYDAEPKSLSSAFLIEVDHLMDQYLYQYEKLKNEEDNIFSEIESLTRRLNSPPFELSDKSIMSPSERIKLGYEELNRLRELRLANLNSLMDACAIELESVWNECSIITAYRKAFRDESSMDPTEENLTRLETEVTKWSQFKSSHTDFYDALTLWVDTIKKIKAIELKRQDPDVMKNRGGILLKLDKEDRKLRNRDLPNHTAHLQAMLTQESQGEDAELFHLVSFEDHTLLSEKENYLSSIIDVVLDSSRVNAPSSSASSAVKASAKHQALGFLYAKRPQVAAANAPRVEVKKPCFDKHNTSNFRG